MNPTFQEILAPFAPDTFAETASPLHVSPYVAAAADRIRARTRIMDAARVDVLQEELAERYRHRPLPQEAQFLLSGLVADLRALATKLREESVS